VVVVFCMQCPSGCAWQMILIKWEKLGKFTTCDFEYQKQLSEFYNRLKIKFFKGLNLGWPNEIIGTKIAIVF